jgi:hypothetical protein
VVLLGKPEPNQPAPSKQCMGHMVFSSRYHRFFFGPPVSLFPFPDLSELLLLRQAMMKIVNPSPNFSTCQFPTTVLAAEW